MEYFCHVLVRGGGKKKTVWTLNPKSAFIDNTISV